MKKTCALVVLLILFHFLPKLIFAQGGEDCAAAQSAGTLVLPVVNLPGTLVGKSNDITRTTPTLITVPNADTYLNSEDWVYYFCAPTSGSVRVTLGDFTGTTVNNAAISVWSGQPSNATYIGSKTNFSNGNNGSRQPAVDVTLTFNAVASQCYFVVIDYDSIRPLTSGDTLKGNPFGYSFYMQYVPVLPLNAECTNMGFESGTNDWYGSYGNTIQAGGPTARSPIYTPAYYAISPSQHQIMTGGVDAYGAFSRVCPFIPGAQSLRLGDGTSSNFGGASVEQTFNVTAQNANLTYYYALVIQDANAGSVSTHTKSDQPFFKAEVFDCNGNLVTCGEYVSFGADDLTGFTESLVTTPAGVYYKSWTPIYLNLAKLGLLGSCATLRFTVGDCALGAHFAYAYVDAECSAIPTIDNTTICEGKTATLIAPNGYTDYIWKDGTGATIGTTKLLTVSPSTQTTYNATLTSEAGPLCTTDLTATVFVDPNPIVDAGNDGAICPGDSMTIGSAALTGYSYSWTPTTGLSSAIVASPRVAMANNTTAPITIKYKVVMTSLTSGCDSVDSVTVTINPNPAPPTSQPVVYCEGEQAVPLVATPNTGITWYGKNETGGSSDITAPTPKTTMSNPKPRSTDTAYYFSQTVAGCESPRASVVVTVKARPTANAGSPQKVCVGDSVLLEGDTAFAASATWSGGLGGTYEPANIPKSIYRPSAADYANGDVTLTLTTDDPSGSCPAASSDIKIDFKKLPKAGFSNPINKCEPYCPIFTGIDSLTGVNITKWEWDFGDPSSGTDNYASSQLAEHCYSANTYVVTLTATSDEGCVYKATPTDTLEVYPLPKSDFTFDPNPITILNSTTTLLTVNYTPDNIFWRYDYGDGDADSSVNSFNPRHEYDNTAGATYTAVLTVRNENCESVIPHLIEVGPEFTFYIPNAFTPNGDLSNELFYGKGIGIVNYDLWIYDRWGDKVFYGSGVPVEDVAWDGKSNDGTKISQQDVYIWKVKLVDVFGEEHNYRGTVTLVR